MNSVITKNVNVKRAKKEEIAVWDQMVKQWNLTADILFQK